MQMLANGGDGSTESEQGDRDERETARTRRGSHFFSIPTYCLRNFATLGAMTTLQYG